MNWQKISTQEENEDTKIYVSPKIDDPKLKKIKGKQHGNNRRGEKSI